MNKQRFVKFIAIVAGLLTIRKFYYTLYHKYKRFPPGPGIGYPGFGFIIHLIFSPKKFVEMIAKEYGAISFVPVGMNNVIFLNNSKLVSKLMKKKEFYHRPGWKNGALPPQNFGTTANSKEWVKRRAYAQKSLFSLSDTSFILKHTKQILFSEIFVELDNNYTNENKLWVPSTHIPHIGFNNMFTAIFNRTLPVTDGWVFKYIKLIENRNNALNTVLLLNTFFPIKIPNFIIDFVCSMDKDERILDASLINWMTTKGGFTVDIHENILHRNNYRVSDVKNEKVYIDLLIQEIKQNNITVLEAIHDVQVFFYAGLHTTIHAVEFGFLLLAKYPHVQEKVYNELVTVMKEYNKSEFDFTFIQKLHIFRAFIYELLRIADLVPTGIPHTIHKDYTVKIDANTEYVIPSESIIQINAHYIHKWQEWKEGMTDECKLSEDNDVHFEYWLNDKNEFQMNDNFVSFGIGKRDCVGQEFAIKTLHTIFALFILKYKFIAPDIDNFQIKQLWNGVKEVQPKIGIFIQKRKFIN